MKQGRKIKKIKCPRLVPLRETEAIPAPDIFTKERDKVYEPARIGREVEIGKQITPT
jgi:hypothetical protein